MKKHFNAESTISLLIALSLFTTIYLIYSQWQSQQNQQANLLYQQQQALQIANNQIGLLMAAMPCERSVSQNDLQFDIQCNNQKIEVRFPLGKIEIKKP